MTALCELLAHGGRPSAAARLFPTAPRPFLDLSTGINPEPYPAPPAASAARARLPEPEEISALEAAAAQAFGLPADAVLAVPGGEAGIRLLATAVAGRRIVVASPTYGGHAEAFEAAGVTVLTAPFDALEAAAEGADLLILVSPNNPDGRVLHRSRLERLMGTLRPHGGRLLLDQAFVEADPAADLSASVVDPAFEGRVLALRSFGKFYGLAGLRLGFLAGAPPAIDPLRRRLGAWPVSADAISAGVKAYGDADWRTAARARLRKKAHKLDALLRGTGYAVVGGSSLFRLTAAKDAPCRFTRLAEAGVLVRPFAYDRSWLRFGLPAEADWPRLQAALERSRG